MGLLWSCLEPSLSDMGAPPGLFSESSPPWPISSPLSKPASLAWDGMQELVASYAPCPLANLPMFCYSSVLEKARKTSVFAVHSVIIPELASQINKRIGKLVIWKDYNDNTSEEHSGHGIHCVEATAPCNLLPKDCRF